MISILILSLMLGLSLRLRGIDRAAGVSFAVLYLCHEAFLSNAPGLWYILSDAGIAFVLILILARQCASEYVEHLMIVCAFLIVFSLVSWVVWELDMDVNAANLCGYFLLLSACIVTLRGAGHGPAECDIDWPDIFRDDSQSGYNHSDLQ